MQLVVGAKADEFPGFVSTDARSDRAPLDIRRRSDWLRYFPPASLDVILCEHVLEHLTVDDALEALKNFRAFLKPGGFARVAVPDALYPNPNYHAFCAPGRFGQWFFETFIYGSDEPAHKVHYDVYSLSSLIWQSGLTPYPREWHDAAGQFWRVPYDVNAAPVKRRAGTEYAYNFYAPVLGFQNLSLIVDAVKES